MTQPDLVWGVVLKPVRGEAGDVSYGGLAIFVTNGEQEIEVVRVAFARRHSQNPDQEFETVLMEQVERVEAAADVMNDYDAKTRAAQELAITEARQRLEAILGDFKTKTKEMV